MHLRTLLSGTLALLVLSSPATASDGGRPLTLFKTGIDLPTPSLPKLFGGRQDKAAPVQMAQAGDPRITALEEQVRALSGTIEELNFQILQMQEQLRKMQEDNEFRFQELEQKKSDAGAAPDTSVAGTAPAAGPPAAAGTTASTTPAGPGTIEEVIVEDGTGEPGATTGAPARTFGTITFDASGNVTGGADGGLPGVAVGSDGATAPSDETVVAALPATDDPDEVYRNAYQFILSGDYGTAETGFRDHITRFPADPQTADARFWLGEAQLGQKKYRDAAETLLAANKEFPSARKAPDMLLKLGVSLVGLNQRDVACATFTEIGRRYPDISGALKERVKQEQALASC